MSYGYLKLEPKLRVKSLNLWLDYSNYVQQIKSKMEVFLQKGPSIFPRT